MEEWLVKHGVQGVLTGFIVWLGYLVKRRDKTIDGIEEKIDQMPFVYAMKDDVREIKSDVKDVKNYLMNKNTGD